MSRLRRALSRLAGRRSRPSSPSTPELARVERELAELRSELDELRTETRRAAELYDLVFERLRGDEAVR